MIRKIGWQVHPDSPDLSHKLTPTEQSLLVILMSYEGSPCDLTDDSLAFRVKRHPRTVSEALRSLDRHGWIQRVTSTAKLTAKGFRRRRAIYVASPASLEEGALLAANLLRSEGVNVTDPCRELSCTPWQYGRWVRQARRNGWMFVGNDESGQRSLVLLSDFPETGQAPLLQLPSSQGLPALVDRLLRLVEQHDGKLGWTNRKVSDALGCSEPQAAKAISRAVEEGKLFSPVRGRNRLLVLGTLDSDDPALLLDSKQKLRIFIEEYGKTRASNSDLCKITGRGSTQTRKLLTELLMEGVIVARGQGKARVLLSADVAANMLSEDD